MNSKPAKAEQGINVIELLCGAGVSVALGIGGWLFKWSKKTDETLSRHGVRISAMERAHTQCLAERKQAEQEIWDRFNERMDAHTAQLTQVAQSIGRLEGMLSRNDR